MVIECKTCSSRFNLDENLLKPGGSRVRCSKCGTVFFAYPEPIGSSRDYSLETDGMRKDTVQAEGATPFSEKREHPRVPVSIPVLCDGLDLDGNPHDLHIGVIKEVSQGGLTVELFSSPTCEQVSLSFIDVENRDVQIRAKVVHSRIEDSFKTRVGLSPKGLPMEIEHFVDQVMRTHHSSYRADPQVQIQGIQRSGYPSTS